jgi:hypothetical protein
MSLAYKFLSAGRVGRFSGYEWPAPGDGGPGGWVRAARPLRVCVDAIHACRARDLPFWLDDELWVIELEGEVFAQDTKVVAGGGRLVSQVSGWTGEAALDFASACTLRSRDHALRTVRAAGFKEESAALAEAFTPAAIHERAQELMALDSPPARAALGYAVDAGKFAATDPPATSAYIAAHAAAHVGGRAAMAAERAWQSEWLVDRLALEPSL